MNFSDIFRRSFLEGFSSMDLSLSAIVLSVAVTCLFSAYIFVTYRVVTRKTFYDKNMDLSLAVIPVIVCSIVLAIQSSLVISLGMVGALSIVRFRTAIKNPMDLVFLFWAISVGIICGAGIPGLAMLLSVVVTLAIWIINICPVAKAPVLLLVNADTPAVKAQILSVVETNVHAFTVKTQTLEKNKLSMIIEIRIDDQNRLLEDISAIQGITRCALVHHDGEVSC